MNSWLVEKEMNALRIDKFISERMDGVSRSYIQKLIKDGLVTVDLKPVKANYKVNEGERVEVALPEPVSLDIEPQNIPLDILYEDKDVLLVNKPKDMVVHPSAGHLDGTLVNALLAGPTQGGLVSPFPQGLSLQSWELEDGLLTLNFSEQYGGLADISLTLADYCLVLTLSQVEGVDTVQIQSAGHTYHSRSHQTMKADEVLTDQSLPEEDLRPSGEEN